MNNKSGSEMGDGLDCKCEARSSHECGCDADWTPSEVYRLRNELSHLQKLCEEQKGELERVKEGQRIDNDYVQIYKSKAERLEALVEEQKAELKKEHTKVLDYAVELCNQREKIEEQKGEIERLKKAHLCGWCGSNDLVCGKAWKDERDGLKSQLATQTERIKELEHRVEVCQKFHGQALKQESLGDGK